MASVKPRLLWQRRLVCLRTSFSFVGYGNCGHALWAKERKRRVYQKAIDKRTYYLALCPPDYKFHTPQTHSLFADFDSVIWLKLGARKDYYLIYEV
jgi:hypothetical protein